MRPKTQFDTCEIEQSFFPTLQQTTDNDRASLLAEISPFVGLFLNACWGLLGVTIGLILRGGEQPSVLTRQAATGVSERSSSLSLC